MVKCPKCGKDYPNSYNYCTNCGAPLKGVGKQFGAMKRKYQTEIEEETKGLNKNK